jgi:hypothetical protein
VSTYAELVERGCLCGSDRPADCTVHGPRDLRGIAAFFKAGMPGGFPMEANCAICGAPGLLYPNIELDDPKRSGENRRTLVCPECSGPAAETALRADAQQFGYRLNERRVFA